MIGATTAERKSWRQKALLVLAGLAAGYLVAQLLVNIYEFAHPTEFKNYWVLEDTGLSLHFDPVLGRRFTTAPSRLAMLSSDGVKFLGTYRGNSQGLQSRFDFSPQRPPGMKKRIAILGDSFTAGEGMEWNWPDRIHQQASDHAEPMEILNFSQGGWGLGNWAHVVTHMIAPQNYELDALVFAVWCDDLGRTFYFMDQRGFDRVADARAESWDPETYPRTVDEARPLLRLAPFNYVLPPEQFDQALRGEWTPPVRRRFRWDLILRVANRVHLWRARQEDACPLAGRVAFDPRREERVQDLHRYLQARHIPAMVVYLPTELVAARSQNPALELTEVQQFASDIGARFVDGREAFAGLTPAQVHAEWRPLDVHWNQAGSDRFADYMHKILSAWEASGLTRSSWLAPGCTTCSPRAFGTQVSAR